VTSVPLHPALVHIPLGLAFVLPALALGFSWALWKGHVRPRAWLAIVLLQALLLGGGLLAMKTGQGEEKRVESIVPEPALETHEELAEQFLWATGITLLPAALVLILRRPGAVRALAGMTVIGTLLVAAAAMRVGHAGGQLVYVHNAATAYASDNTNATANRNPDTRLLEKGPAVGDDDDKER
jgi:uncharacterized membrane protein